MKGLFLGISGKMIKTINVKQIKKKKDARRNIGKNRSKSWTFLIVGVALQVIGFFLKMY